MSVCRDRERMQHQDQVCVSCAEHHHLNNDREGTLCHQCGFLAPRQFQHLSEPEVKVTPSPLRSSYIPTPKQYSRVRGVILNVQNYSDNWCVLYATLAKQLWGTDGAVGIKKSRATTYKPYLFTLKTEGLSFPLPLHQMWKYECMNNLTINVYSVDEEGGGIKLVYKSKRAQDDPYNFLMIVSKSKNDSALWHYAWIRNLDKLWRVNKEWRRNLAKLNKLSTDRSRHPSALRL